MKKCIIFFIRIGLQFGLALLFIFSFGFESLAQNGPLIQWDKVFGGTNEDAFTSFQQTTDGGYILGGHSNSVNSGDKSQTTRGQFDYWVIKLDANFNKQWDRTWGGSQGEGLYAVKQTKDGGYILGGSSQSGISGDKTGAHRGGSTDYWVVKLNASGNKVWDKSIGGSQNDDLTSLFQTSDGGYIIGGTSNSPVSGEKSQIFRGALDYWIVKLDANGNKLWDKTFGGNSNDYFRSLYPTSDKGFILLGNSSSGISGDKTHASIGVVDLWLIKVDSLGTKIWDKTIGSTGADGLYSNYIQQTSDGGYILASDSEAGVGGDKTQPLRGVVDFWILKLDGTGNKVWDRTFGGSDIDVPGFVQQTPDGGYIIGGISTSGISGDKTQAAKGDRDCWIIRLDNNGNKMWDKTIGGNNFDGASALVRTSDGGYLLGCSSNSGISGDKTQASKGGSDYWLVKLGPDVLGFEETETNHSVVLHPNPSQGIFNLQLTGISASKAEVSVTDLLGRVILKKDLMVMNKQVSEKLEMEAAKGMYLLQVKAGNQTTTHRIVVE